jgi:hypothetical protein
MGIPVPQVLAALLAIPNYTVMVITAVCPTPHIMLEKLREGPLADQPPELA